MLLDDVPETAITKMVPLFEIATELGHNFAPNHHPNNILRLLSIRATSDTER